MPASLSFFDISSDIQELKGIEHMNEFKSRLRVGNSD